ncbi:MAG: acetyl-CoA carboxylase biotin carboxyl carrier protein [Candidatus Omnitrophica bacterium]|nr:acetyl-CoA carboxylase biotin carboxyl carrier protein [Candidatus Omnitrophota bacterium]
MTIKELKDMINLMQEHGLSELEIEKNGFKIRLKKGASGAIVQEAIISQPKSLREETSTQAQGSTSELEAGVTIVKSPMVGTFYAAPAPDAEPYVARGKEIKVGDVLCIIEAMKLMNEIKSETSGRVSDILVENGQPVEFDQPLFKIQKL